MAESVIEDEELRERRRLSNGKIARAVYWKSLGPHEANGREIGRIGFYAEGEEAPCWVGVDWHYRETPEELAEQYGVPIIEV